MTREEPGLTGNRLRTPRAAAIAGILFSLLLTTSILLLHYAVPGDPSDPAAIAQLDPGKVKVALHLIPFVGIAFLWFVGVLRDRLSDREDRLFATVFLGSALLFLAMLFAGAAVMGSIIVTRSDGPADPPQSPTFLLARLLTSNIVNIYAIKMASVFMLVTSTLVWKTGIAPRWMAFTGYALSLPLLFGGRMIDWGFLVFPAWVMLVSVHALADGLRRGRSS
jgi:hypothetical protein